MRDDKHLGRSKAGEKSFLSWAGSDWHKPGEIDDDPKQRTPALPKADHIRWMARNPSMTAGKTAVFSTSTTHNSGPAAGSTENDQSNWFPSRHLGEPATKALPAPALESILDHTTQGASQGLTEETHAATVPATAF